MTTKIRLNVLPNTTECTQLELAQGLMTSGQGPGPPKWGGGAQSWALCRGYMLCVRLQRQTSTCLKVEETCLSAPALDGKKKETSNSLVQRESDRKSQGPPGIYGRWWKLGQTHTRMTRHPVLQAPTGLRRGALRPALLGWCARQRGLTAGEGVSHALLSVS